MERKIYEKNYKDIMEIVDSKTDVPDGRQPDVDEFFRSMQEDYAYMIVPERIASKQKFIEAVKSFSDVFEESVEIIEHNFELVARLDMDMIVVSGYAKELFVNMLSISDEIQYIPGKDGMILFLCFYTHEQFYKGEKRRNIM